MYIAAAVLQLAIVPPWYSWDLKISHKILKLKTDMSESQQYPSELCLIRNEHIINVSLFKLIYFQLGFNSRNRKWSYLPYHVRQTFKGSLCEPNMIKLIKLLLRIKHILDKRWYFKLSNFIRTIFSFSFDRWFVKNILFIEE